MERQASVSHFAIINSSLVKGQKYMTLNKVEMIGNMVADPTSNKTKSGHTVAKFRLATNTGAKSSDRGGSATDFHRCTAFGRVGDVVETYLKKGDKIYIEGQLKTVQRAEKQEERRTTYEIAVRNLIMLGGGQKHQRKEATNDDVMID